MHADAEEQILSEIKKANVPVGSTYLCQKVCLSQASIARLLRQLEAKHYVERVSNKGRILTEEGARYLENRVRTEGYGEYVDALRSLTTAKSISAYIDITEARILIETKTAELSAENASDAEIAELGNMLAQTRQKAVLGQEDLSFHLKVAQICGKPILSNLLDILMLQRDTYAPLFSLHNAFLPASLSHDAIFEAIRGRNASLAGQLMHDHLSSFIAALQGEA